MSRILWFLGFCLIASSCVENSEDDNPPMDDTIFFTGITPTDPNGLALGDPDPTDWRFDDEWTEQEAALFPEEPTFALGCMPNINYEIMAFPNPSNGIFSLLFQKESTTQVELRLVNEDFNTLISIDEVAQDIIQLNAGTFGIKDTVRLYYRFIEGNCEYRGPGDIVIE
jgi:hypothetical protein